MIREFISGSPEETKEFAKTIAKNLKSGDILALYGSLGAGKTTFIQGLVASLGYKGKVFSPTFIFVRPYKISEPETASRDQEKKIRIFYHIDLYRIEKPADLKTIGIEEFLNEGGSISAIEWPEKIGEELPEKTIKIKIESLDETKRRITVSS
ncbi:MAG: tRNA (adenosine(37)-N6)-threonylcarbamoyltransferase complex ATPase subunit type 1 TsaE [Candidatus Woykebacteria bacterium RBG_16_44_10]|uniref:tRNA threonylcarbamoyladenosine biosynthesis protein TsaE n=1 Tax=Candidatus Woykebacteria bacterium RBG_16_44_10 TaxID=1802597 RepID=A0A1G1WFN9_9BACT|nr:MAG: tRNA (adenosine(37)-N6)-threonylcarbamoyltransferase complex ATPase subunit type 1 TsaE [Candidatus Woykebacteria bacterium RBG_16_44_10]